MFRQTSRLMLQTSTKSSFLNKKQFPQLRLLSSSLNQNSKDSTNKVLVFTGNKNVDEKLDKLLQKVYQLMSIYEELIGLKELKQAQQSVIEVSF